MHHLTLIRHGESQWNRDNRFTGWSDIDLTQEGIAQIRSAAAALQAAGWWFDLAYSSVLRRCIRSQWILSDATACMWVPLVVDWRLNERHYGALTGMAKSQAIEPYGAVQVQRWRRSYEAQPPAYQENAESVPLIDRRYDGIAVADLPNSESLQQTAARVQRVWKESISAALLAGHRVVVMAHGNSLRALVKQLEGISDVAISQLEVPNAVPWIYELDSRLEPVRKQILAVPPRALSEIL